MTDPMEAILQLKLQSSLFPVSSRYHGIETDIMELADGDNIIYIRRRFLPPLDGFTVIKEHIVVQGDRPDNLAFLYLGDPEQFWRICDANGVMDPNELIETVGRQIKITLPEGISGAANV
jgi:hypothetical protein